LNETLFNAEKKGHSVWFMSHLFPGGGESTQALNLRLHQIIHPYAHILKGSFFGHSHKDQFKLVNHSWVALVAPSVVPTALGACVRVYEYSDSTYDLLDYINYCANISEKTLTFSKVYSFKKMYSLPDVSVQSWKTLVDQFTYNDTVRFKYCSNYLGATTNDPILCDRLIHDTVVNFT
jgi:sphingomyelin phosphodiesterase